MNEFALQTTSGQSLYGLLTLTSGTSPGGFWNGSSLTSPTTATWSAFAVPFTELAGSGLYQASMPASLALPGRFAILPRVAGTLTPLPSDAAVSENAGDVTIIDWNAAKALSLNDVLGIGGGPVAVSFATVPNSITGNLIYDNAQGVGIGGAWVGIFFQTDWPTNPGDPQASTTTNTDGSWGPLFLQPGTYVAVFNKQGVSGPDVSAPFTV